MMKFALSLLFLWSILPTAADADVDYDQLIVDLREPSQITNPTERLEAYDAVLLIHGVKVTTAVVPTDSRWTVSVSVDPLYDHKRFVFRVEVDTGSSSWESPILLVLRKDGDKTEVYINWQDYLGDDSDSLRKRKNVTTRVGSSDAVTDLWSISTDGKATFYPHDATSFIRVLSEVDTFVARCTPYSESPVTVVLDVRGLKEAAEPYLEELGWWNEDSTGEDGTGSAVGEDGPPAFEWKDGSGQRSVWYFPLPDLKALNLMEVQSIRVGIRFEVDEEGFVRTAAIVESNAPSAEVDSAILAAFRTWRFDPAPRAGIQEGTVKFKIPVRR